MIKKVIAAAGLMFCLGCTERQLNYDVPSVDLNGDSKGDVVYYENRKDFSMIAATEHVDKYSFVYVRFLKENGELTFPRNIGSFNGHTQKVYFEDVNKDGKLDVVVQTEFEKYVILNKGKGRFESSKKY